MKFASAEIETAPETLSFPEQAVQLRRAVRAYMGRRISNPASADDLTQDVFAKVIKQLPQVRDSRKLIGWIFRIARNTVIDHFRSSRLNTFVDADRGAGDSTQPEVIGREEARLQDDLNAYVRSVIHTLPANDRAALLLTEYEGLSQVELAARLGLSVSAAKSRVQRARAKVRKIIDRCCHIKVDRYGQVVNCTPRQRCDCN